MLIKVSYGKNKTREGRFRAKGQILIPTPESVEYFSDPDEGSTFDTEAQAEERAWSLAVTWRDREMPYAEIADDKGRSKPAAADWRPD